MLQAALPPSFPLRPPFDRRRSLRPQTSAGGECTINPMKKIPLLIACTTLLGVAPQILAQSLAIDSFDGPITANEIASFKSYIQTIQPNTWTTVDNMTNEYAQNISAQRLKAMGQMYEMTGDVVILNRMIYFCDVLLSERNDILAAPYGQHVMWTGTITHDWIQSQTDPNASANAPAGEGAGHLAYCALLILRNSALLSQIVPDYDPYDHGRTYGQRAATFLAEADDVYSSTVFPYYLDLSISNRMYWPANIPNQSGAVPWNQQAMFTWGMMYSAAAHVILGDNPTLVAQYDSILNAAFNWFFNDSSSHSIFTTTQGNAAYRWGYNPTSYTSHIEDQNHARLDVQWFYRAYDMGRWGLTSAQVAPFANTFCDVMMLGPRWIAGRTDGNTTLSGNAAPRTSVGDGYYLLTQFRPDKYYDMLSSAFTQGGSTTAIFNYSNFLWAKNKRYLAGYSVNFSPTPDAYTMAQTVTLASTVAGATIRYTTDGSTPTQTSGTVYSSPFTVSQTTVVKAIAYTTSFTSPVSTANYTIWAAQPTTSPAAGTYVGTQMVTITSTTPGATIRYTTDLTTPTKTYGTVYTGPIAISSSKTIRAIAYTSTLSASNLRTSGYTINASATAAKPTFSPVGGTYSSAQSVTISSATPGAAIYYTTDGTAPTTASTLYTGPVAVTTGLPLNAIAVASGLLNSATATANYVLGATGMPGISLASGTYTGEQTVTLTSDTAGATILFTLDGTTPSGTHGSVYTGPIKIRQSCTLKVYAYADYRTGSPVASATYIISRTIYTTDGFVNIPISSAQTGTFTATVDAMPSVSPGNMTIALCQGAQTSYTGLACIVRFNLSGIIDARNGNAYAAASAIPFSAGVSYHFRFVVNVSTHTYSIYVTPAGGSEVTVGLNYAFRTEQAGAIKLDTWNVDVNPTPGGSVTVSNWAP